MKEEIPYLSLEPQHREVASEIMEAISSAILDVKLNHVDDWTTQRRAIATDYFSLLIGVGDVILPRIAEGCTHVFHVFTIRTN